MVMWRSNAWSLGIRESDSPSCSAGIGAHSTRRSGSRNTYIGRTGRRGRTCYSWPACRFAGPEVADEAQPDRGWGLVLPSIARGQPTYRQGASRASPWPLGDV